MMCRRSMTLAVFGAAVLSASVVSVATYAQVREKPPPAGAVYRVTHWPDHTGPDESYAKGVEEHLNKMAADGWRFHSEFVGQNVKMMLFERAAGH